MPQTIGFIGLGNMGLPMAGQLLKAGHTVRAFDAAPVVLDKAADLGAIATRSIADAVDGASVAVTMLPAGRHVRSVYLESGGLIDSCASDTLLIDCSTIDVDTSREVGDAAVKAGLEIVDAPVTGGVMAARAGKLNFIVGGTEQSFKLAEPILSVMGRRIFYAGAHGSGVGVKICNNMCLGVSMVAAAETLMLAKRLGLDIDRTYEIISNSSGQNWALSNYCPLPGLVEGVPSNTGYRPGFTAAMMRKDLRLAMDAVESVDACAPMGAEALSVFSLFCANGDEATDYSGISKLVGGDAWDYPFEPQDE